MATAIEVENVVKRFGQTIALRGVSLEIREGELFAILGPSGCGKTTLLRIIAGFEVPDSGRVYLKGKDVTNVPPDKRGTVMVFQNWALWPHMTVYENVAFGLRLRKLPEAEIRRKVLQTLEMLGLRGLENRFPSQLSGGQQQRVALARALVVEPEVLLLDEPLSNLDAKLRLRLRGELKQLQKKLGITMVYVTHDQEEAMSLADRIALMRNGLIEQVGSPSTLYKKPKTLFTAAFLGRTSLLLGKVMDAGDDKVLVRAGEIDIVAQNHGLQKGEGAAVVIKAEGARMEPHKGRETVKIRGTVTVSMYVGAFVEVRVRIPGSKYEVMLDLPLDTPAPGPGQEVEFYVPLDNIHAYPIEEDVIKEIAEQA